MVLSRTCRNLLAIILLGASSAWGANNYKTNFLNTYCFPQANCNLYWPMDESSGTIEDQCQQNCVLSSGYPLTAFNTPTFGQAGVLPAPARGTSILFTAANSEYLEGSANDTGTGPADTGLPFTAGCWAKPDTGSNRILLSASHKPLTDGGSQRDWNLVARSDGKLGQAWFENVAAGNGVTQSTTGTTVITTNTWHFWVFTWDNTFPPGGPETTTIYLDGVAEGTTTGFSATGPDSVEVFQVGATTSVVSPNYLEGYAQDCFIIRRLLSPAEIECLFACETATDDWPYTVKAPWVPHHVDSGYFAGLLERGYNTGLWAEKVARPRIFGVFSPHAALPRTFLK